MRWDTIWLVICTVTSLAILGVLGWAVISLVNHVTGG